MNNLPIGVYVVLRLKERRFVYGYRLSDGWRWKGSDLVHQIEEIESYRLLTESEYHTLYCDESYEEYLDKFR